VRTWGASRRQRACLRQGSTPRCRIRHTW
jgi:hypothetical protein